MEPEVGSHLFHEEVWKHEIGGVWRPCEKPKWCERATRKIWKITNHQPRLAEWSGSKRDVEAKGLPRAGVCRINSNGHIGIRVSVLRVVSPKRFSVVCLGEPR